MYEHHFVILQEVWKPILVKCATYTSEMWRLETSATHTLTMDFMVKRLWIFIEGAVDVFLGMLGN